MAWRRPGDKPLSEPMLVSLSLGLHEVLMLNDVILPVYATAMPLIFKKKMNIGSASVRQMSSHVKDPSTTDDLVLLMKLNCVYHQRYPLFFYFRI